MADDYSSRKFLVTVLVILLTAGLAVIDKMDGNIGLVFAACVTAYNWANAHKAKQATPDF